MKLIVAFLMLGIIALPGVTNPLVGSWKVFSWTDTPEKGMPYFPFGDKPRGHFVFTADGHLSVQVAADPNGTIPAALPHKGFDDLVLDGTTTPYIGYFGTYKADFNAGTLSVDLEGSSAPVYIRSDISRMIRFDGSRLIISGQARRPDGKVWIWERILVRE